PRGAVRADTRIPLLPGCLQAASRHRRHPMTGLCMSHAFEFRTIEIDGQTLRTAVRRGKPHLTPLLVFNGIGANLELVFPFIQARDPELTELAFDVPGVGGSSTPARSYRSPGLARLPARMLDYLDFGQVCALGVSWGGALAQQFAYDYP